MLALVVKNLPASARGVRDTSQSPGWEDPLEEGVATHSSYSCLEIPRTEELGGFRSVGSQESDMTEGLRPHSPSGPYHYPTLQTRKLQLRDVQLLAQSHIATNHRQKISSFTVSPGLSPSMGLRLPILKTKKVQEIPLWSSA